MSGGAERWHAPAGLAGYAWRAVEPRAALLLQHGYAEHGGRYLEHCGRLVPRLVALGIDVFAFDLAGHGRSPGARGVTDVGRMADAHIEARRSLARPGRPLFLFGHSLGGLVTAGSVVREPDGVAGVVLSAPALLIEAAAPLRLLARVVAQVAPGLGVAPLLPPDGISRIEAEVRAYLDDPLVFRRKLPALLGASALKLSKEGWRGYPAWRAPTLVAHGTADTFTDPAGSERFTAGIASADKELVMVEGGRHELLNDLPAAEVMAAVLGWLKARLQI